MEQREEQTHEQSQTGEEKQAQHKIKMGGEYEGHQIPDVKVEDQGQDHNVPVHQGQPEI